ncbi:hypothetical protein SESBI_03165 [Sesbania bispinosa]|nr:hypothetical protein SESBI_03165 [Sesbania bispinosa]
MDNYASSGGSTLSSSSGFDLNRFCICGVKSKLQTSWTEKNPGRRASKIVNSFKKKNEKLKVVIEAQKSELCALQEKLGVKSAEVLKLTHMKDSCDPY